MENNYLSHHGVKGQKWGERKYQYQDGSLTAEGRRHYGYGDGDRQRLRAEIKMVRERARSERKMARAQTAEQIKNERQKKKLDAKIQQARNSDRLKEVRDQKRKIAEFKAKHPLQYRKIKPYLNENGVLTDEGKMLFFGNGQKKNIKNMSNQDLKNAIDRMQLKNQYNEQVSNYNRHDPKQQALYRAKKVASAGAITFVMSMASQSAANLITGGTDSVKENLKENGKRAALAAIGASGITLTNLMGLSGKKGGKSYNAFEFKNPFDKNNKNNDNDNESGKSKNKKSDSDWVQNNSNKQFQRHVNKVRSEARAQRDIVKWDKERIRVENMVNRIANTRRAQNIASNWQTTYRSTYESGREAARNLGINLNNPINNIYRPNIEIPEELRR